MMRAGTPATTAFSGTSCVTTAPAAMTAPFPTVVPSIMTAFAPISTLSPTVTGFALGVIEGLTKYFYPEASNTVVFVLMVLVLLVKPTGLTGRAN